MEVEHRAYGAVGAMLLETGQGYESRHLQKAGRRPDGAGCLGPTIGQKARTSPPGTDRGRWRAARLRAPAQGRPTCRQHAAAPESGVRGTLTSSMRREPSRVG